MIRQAWVEVNLSNIENNIKNIKTLLNDNTQIMAVVKANGYGHGALEVSRTAINSGVSRLGVALVEEARDLRSNGISVPINLLTAPEKNSAQRIKEMELIPVVFNEEHLEELKDISTRVHIKVDTGMNRIGVKQRDIDSFIKKIKSKPNLKVEGIYTHFATADNPESDLFKKQVEDFSKIAQKYRDEVEIIHAANSAATLFAPETNYDMVRIGIALYGLRPSVIKENPIELRPALALKAKISNIKEIDKGESVSYGAKYTADEREFIATIPVGYADGYFRGLTNKSKVIVNDKEQQQVGVICMDQFMIKVKDDKIKIGDTATLIGKENDSSFLADDIAKILKTINYEVVCAIADRVPRIYV